MLEGVYVGNKWCEVPSRVKNEVLKFYKDRFFRITRSKNKIR